MKKKQNKQKNYETKINIRCYGEKLITKQQPEKEIKECLPNTCFFNWCQSSFKKT